MRWSSTTAPAAAPKVASGTYDIPDVAVNVMLITMIGGCVVAQWAVYAISTDNRRDTTIALGVLAVFAVVYSALGIVLYGPLEET